MVATPRLPPGQIETKRLPVVGERCPSAELTDPSVWKLTLDGLIREAVTLGLDDFLDRAGQGLTLDIHCVTSWTRFDSTFTGMPLGELFHDLAVAGNARFVSFEAYSERDHHVSLPLDVALETSWLVHSFDGRPLEIEHGGPVRVITPGRYFYKSLKWVKRITILAKDRLGWWEENSSYHNNADPWPGDQRFVTGSIRPEQLRRFLDAVSYDKYRNRVFIGLDLRVWRPVNKDLRRLYLKNCDLRGVDLSGADLRESNLSLSNLSGAALSGADLSGSDLEGADFAGADLSGADLSETALSATRFDGATLSGARFDGSIGLIEQQESYLSGQGVLL